MLCLACLSWSFGGRECAVDKRPLRGVTKRFKGILSFAIGSNVELDGAHQRQRVRHASGRRVYGPCRCRPLPYRRNGWGRLVLQIGVQVQAVLYPDVARLWAKGDFADVSPHRASDRRSCSRPLAWPWWRARLSPSSRSLIGWSAASSPAAVHWRSCRWRRCDHAEWKRLANCASRHGQAACRAESRGLSTLMFQATALTMIPSIGAVGATSPMWRWAWSGWPACCVSIMSRSPRRRRVLPPDIRGR